MTTQSKQAEILQLQESTIGRTLQVFDDKITVKVHGRDTGNQLASFIGEVPPVAGPPLHVHTREDEFFYVIEGTFRFEANGQQTLVEAGGTVFIPRGTPHTFQNAGTETGRVLTTVQPAGLEQFFEELSDAANGSHHPDMSIVVPLFEKYGMELLGPPLAARAMAAAV